ncbi:15905_t:CDS:2 [Dentiscutata heterogama]|uniref:15905_t:CDS:1 n=1 Tax=Dentiscutata heterogama TaxID=1316150 RepID=A0ACA9LKE0_9GLOM|nr:15905_t:CDS:2 [Dentiscutata heterogama]
MDLINDVWTIIGANDESVNTGNSVSFNTVIGLKHQATEICLHSHSTSYGVTPKSKYQQVTLSSGRNVNDDWQIRRFGPDASYSRLLNGDVISLFHISTGKPALYSHPVLLDDGSQEWLIKLIE